MFVLILASCEQVDKRRGALCQPASANEAECQ